VTAPPGVSPSPKPREGLRKVTEELTRDIRNKDLQARRARGRPLIELSDTVLADVLLSIAYAADVGDPRRHGAARRRRLAPARLRVNARTPEQRLHLAWSGRAPR